MTNVLYDFFNLPSDKRDSLALITATEALTYNDMVTKIGQIQQWLCCQNLNPQDRVVLAIPPSVELYTLLLALIGLNIAAVFIDPGFTPRQMAHCIQSSGAKMVIGRRKAGLLKLRFPECRKRPFIGTDGHLWPLVKRWKLPAASQSPVAVPCLPDDHCMITFTTGTTGASKAADRTHGLLHRQLNAIAMRESDTPPAVWMSTFPVTALYCFSRGVTFCFPDITLRQQRKANPDTILAQLTQWNVDGITASPAFFHALASQDHRYPTVREVFVGGACVSRKLVTKLVKIFPNMDRLVIVYGSTEVEPVCLQNGLKLLDRQDRGANVGPVLPEIRTHLVDTDRLDADIDAGMSIDLETYTVLQGEIGELVLTAPHLMDRYLLEESEKSTKVTDLSGTRWHRMGDMGYFNSAQELVLVGRKKDRIQWAGTRVHPYPIEMELATRHGIHMAALVDAPSIGVVLVIQPEVGQPFDPAEVATTLGQFGLEGISVRSISEMPVDVRHNSRVDRSALIQAISATTSVY